MNKVGFVTIVVNGRVCANPAGIIPCIGQRRHNHADHNGDGAVNKKEFQIGLKQAGLFLPPELIDRIWKLADTDGTGTLAYQEFARKFAAYKVSKSSILSYC